MDPLRILYHHRTRAMDGQAVHVRALIRALRSCGNDVREIAMVHHGDQSSGPAKGGSGLALVNLIPRFGMEILEHAYGSVGTRKIITAAEEFNPHFIYERYALANMAGVNARAKLDLPIFLEVNSPMVYEMERLGKLVFRRWARRVETEIFSRVDLIFAVSNVLKEMLVDLGVQAEKIMVQQNAVNPEDFPTAAASEQFKIELGLKGRRVVGFSGFIRRWHRVDLALEALASLIRSGYRDVQLLVVGEGPGCRYLRHRAVSLGIGDHITITGEVAPEEVPRYAGVFDIAILPAINNYASPLKLFDYLGAGLPVVAPDQRNIREVVTHEKNALLFEPGNSVAFEECLKYLLDNQDACHTLGSAGQALITEKGYTWVENARRVAAVYAERFAR